MELRLTTPDSTLTSLLCFVSSFQFILSAGREAQLLVPVVMETMHKSEAARQAWASNWQGLPIHLLLPWAAQMLSLLDAPEGASFVPALQVRPFPHAQPAM